MARRARLPTSKFADMPPRSAPRQAPTTRRPSITTAISTAYGAPGKVKIPNKLTSKPAQNMLDMMRDMVEEDESESESEQDESTEPKSRSEVLVEKIQRPRYSTTRRISREVQEEVDQIEIEDERDHKIASRRYQSENTQKDSPFAAVTSKIKGLFKSSTKDQETSFITENKIASEARIARPREPLVRKLLHFKEKCVKVYEGAGGPMFFRSLFLIFKVCAWAVLILIALRVWERTHPEDNSISKSLNGVKATIVRPIYSMVEKITSMNLSQPSTPPAEIDLSHLKALKDSTSTQFKHLKSRLDAMESTYNRLAKKAKTPTLAERKTNLFSPGSGLMVDPHLTSPTFDRSPMKKKRLARWHERWRGHVDSIQNGPISAFMPWEDMGDCWCTPSSGGKAQIVVHLAKPIIPKELVVEHLPRDATLQIGSAPKDIELWARFPDTSRRNAIKRGALQYDIHQNVVAEPSEKLIRSLDDTWVRIGQWKYDINGPSNVQAFEIRVPLEDFEAPVSQLAFRSTSSWGPVKNVCLYRLKLHGLIAKSEATQEDALGY